MNLINETRHGVRIRIRPDAVPKIEYMPPRTACLSKHCIYLDTKVRRRCEERGGIQIALYRLRVAQNPAVHAERAPPIDSDDIDTELRDGLHQRRALVGVIDEWH